MFLELPFIAAIPVGHEVVVQLLERATLFSGWEDAGGIVLDRTTGIIWTPWTVPLGLTPENFHIHGVGTDCRRKVDSTAIVAQVVGCQVGSQGYGDQSRLVTGLSLAPVASVPYR